MKSQSWASIRARDISEGRTNETRIAELQEQMRRQQRSAALAELRVSLGMTQQDVADALHVGQARISKLENGELDRNEIGTLASYVEALGGDVEIVARFGEERIRIA
ncbi:MAG: XRE family transcriptional regulator [Actinomycetes bacterium]